MKRFGTLCLLTLVMAVSTQPVAGEPLSRPPLASGHEVTLYRDTWGVPHIFADTPANAAYALGYAQAEDRLEDIYTNIRTAVGTMAEAFGPQFADQDYMMKLAKNAEQCEQYWDTAPAHIKALGDGFMRGVEAFLREYPEKKPPFATELHGWHCAAIQRAMILNWPIEAVLQDLGRKAESPAMGSNAFAIAPQRSAEGCAVLMADPHLPWEGMAVAYEARVHTRDYDQCGFWLVGTPLPAIGHTGFVAWAYCLGSPDTSDVYRVKLNPVNPLQYEYNGAWCNFDVRTAEIAVKGQAAVEKPMLFSRYGPVVGEPDLAEGVAYCGASPYFEQSRLFEQSYRMTTARSCDEFYDALGMMQMMGVNISFADTSGNIQYLRNGRTPIRPQGYNWSAPVPGGSDASRWLGFHDIHDLVQIKNPAQGYFVNCNISPANMMPDSPMTPDKYKPYLYNVTWDTMTARGARLRQLLDADTSLTKDDVMAYALDVYDIRATAWQKALADALATTPHRADADLASAAARIQSWNGQFTRDSAAAPIVRYWRTQCEQSGLPLTDIVQEKPLGPTDQAKLLDALSAAIATMKSIYGRTDVVWGDINVVGRDGKHFACPGTEFGPNDQNTLTQTVMAFATREEPVGSGKFVGSGGSSSTLISLLHRDGIESYSLVNWGQSGDPQSPHYVDQAEKLYVERKFKPTWFKKEDLLKHVESEKAIVIE